MGHGRLATRGAEECRSTRDVRDDMGGSFASREGVVRVHITRRGADADVHQDVHQWVKRRLCGATKINGSRASVPSRKDQWFARAG